MVAGSLGSKATRADDSAGQVARDVGEGEALRHERVGGYQNLSSDSDDDVVAVGRRDIYFVGGPRERSLVRPRRAAVGALPEILIAARVHAAARAGIGRDGGEIGPRFRSRPWRRDACRRNRRRPSTGRSSRCSSRRPASRFARRARRRSRRRPTPIFQVGAVAPAVVTMPLSWRAPRVTLAVASGLTSRL